MSQGKIMKTVIALEKRCTAYKKKKEEEKRPNLNKY